MNTIKKNSSLRNSFESFLQLTDYKLQISVRHNNVSTSDNLCYIFRSYFDKLQALILILLMWRIWWAPNNASRWQMGFNWALKVLIHKKVKWSRYRPGVAQRVGRNIALLFHDLGTRREWVVSSTPRPQFTTRKDTVPILQEAGWAPGPVWTGGNSRPYRDSVPDLPARSQSLYRLSYRGPALVKRVK